jgi:hypothetical protein
MNLMVFPICLLAAAETASAVQQPFTVLKMRCQVAAGPALIACNITETGGADPDRQKGLIYAIEHTNPNLPANTAVGTIIERDIQIIDTGLPLPSVRLPTVVKPTTVALCAWNKSSKESQAAVVQAEIDDGDRGIGRAMTMPDWQASIRACDPSWTRPRLSVLGVLGFAMRKASLELLSQRGIKPALLDRAYLSAPETTKTQMKQVADDLIDRKSHDDAGRVDWTPLYISLGLMPQRLVKPRTPQYYVTEYFLGWQLEMQVDERSVGEARN